MLQKALSILTVIILFGVFSGSFLHAQEKLAKGWIHVKSEHFEMLSQRPEKESIGMLVKLEQFREAFFSEFRLGRAHEPPMTVVLFKDGVEFEPYMPEHGAIGLCYRDSFITLLAINGDPEGRAEAYNTLFHEYVHAILGVRMVRFPTWLNEGLAVMFGSFEVEGDDTVIMGLPDTARASTFVSAVKPTGRGAIPIDTFLNVNHHSYHYTGENHKRYFYAQSWAFTYYLMFSEKHFERPLLPRLVNQMNAREKSQQEIIREVTGMEAEALLKEVERYMEYAWFRPRRGKIASQPIREKVQTRKATEAELTRSLLHIEYKRRHDKHKNAVSRIMNAVKKYPNNPEFHETALVCMLSDGKESEIREYLDRAITHGSSNPYSYLLRARLDFKDIKLSPDTVLSPEESVRLRGWLDKAIELSPDYLEAYALLALVEGYSEEARKETIQAVATAFFSMVDDRLKKRTLLGLAMASWREKKYGKSMDFVKQVFWGKKWSYRDPRGNWWTKEAVPMKELMRASSELQLALNTELLNEKMARELGK